MKRNLIVMLIAGMLLCVVGCPNATDGKLAGHSSALNEQPTIKITFTVEGESADRNFSDELKASGIEVEYGTTIAKLKELIKDDLMLSDDYELKFYRKGTNILYLADEKLFADTKIKAKFEENIKPTDDIQFVLIPEDEYNVQTDDAEEVSVPDVNLSNFIRECYGLTPLAVVDEENPTNNVVGAPITKKHMRRFKIMSFAVCVPHNTGEDKVVLKDLTGMEYATNLEVFNFARSNVTDLSPLADLTKLKKLLCRGNQIVSSEPLEKLVNLEFLCLGGMSAFETVTNLEKLVNLKTLYLDNTSISDISFADKLTKLELLAIDNTKVSNIASIKNLTSLKILRIEGHKPAVPWETPPRIESLAALENLTNLEELKFSRHDIDDISILRKLTKLNKLELAHNNLLEDFSPLLDLKWIVNDDLQLRYDFPWSDPPKKNLDFNNSLECIKAAKDFKAKWDIADDSEKENLKVGEYASLEDNVKLFLKAIVEN